MPIVGAFDQAGTLPLNRLGAIDSALGIPVTIGLPSTPSPGPPVVALNIPGASPGNIAYSYQIVGVHPNALVGDTMPSAPTTILNGPAVLSAANSILLAWNPIPGITLYRVLRSDPRVAGGAFQTLGTTASTTFTDSGQAAAAYTPATNQPLLPTTVQGTVTAAALGGTSANLAIFAIPPGEWSISSQPAANTQATVSRAASAGVRHIARGVTADFVATAVLAAATLGTVVLRDGASGVGAVIGGRYLALPLTPAGTTPVPNDTQSPPLNIPGTAGNAMTLEFTAAGGASTFEAVWLNGTDAT